MISPQATTFLTEDEERLKDFKLRLQVRERIFNFPLSEERFFVSWFLFGEWEWLRPVSVSCARSHWIYWEVKGIPENCWNEGSLKLNQLKEENLHDPLQAKPADGTDDVKVKQIALRTNENIQMIIKDLFHSPPIYKAAVTLSFKVGTWLASDQTIIFGNC